MQGDRVADDRFVRWISDAAVSLDRFQRLVKSSLGRPPEILGRTGSEAKEIGDLAEPRRPAADESSLWMSDVETGQKKFLLLTPRLSELLEDDLGDDVLVWLVLAGLGRTRRKISRLEGISPKGAAPIATLSPTACLEPTNFPEL